MFHVEHPRRPQVPGRWEALWNAARGEQSTQGVMGSSGGEMFHVEQWMCLYPGGE